jgi:hypothetical protein
MFSHPHKTALGYSVQETEFFEGKASLKHIYEFSPYKRENTILHHYKDQLVNAV